eukprot:scaffold45572_cov42-Phaeocystis_antarctica.AAC.1
MTMTRFSLPRGSSAGEEGDFYTAGEVDAVTRLQAGERGRAARAEVDEMRDAVPGAAPPALRAEAAGEPPHAAAPGGGGGGGGGG